jgi:hypothetical protein
MSAEKPSGRGTWVAAGAAVIAALCCFAGPAVLAVVAGSAIGDGLGLAIAAPCAALVAVVAGLALRRRHRC